MKKSSEIVYFELNNWAAGVNYPNDYWEIDYEGYYYDDWRN